MRGTVFQDDRLDVHQVRRLIKGTAGEVPALIVYSAPRELMDGQRIGMMGDGGQDQ